MKSNWIFLIIFILYILGFFSHALYLKKTVYGDGQFYYSWLRSAVIDQDINFINEYTHFHTSQPRTKTNIPGNKYAIGPAILWTFPYLFTHNILRGDGYELPYQLAAGLTSVLFALFGLILLYRVLLQYFHEKPAIFTVLAIAFTTNLFFYGSLDTVNSHAISFFAASMYLSVILTKQKNWFVIGISLGLLGIIRTQDLIFGILFLPFFFLHTSGRIVAVSHLIIGLLLMILPQLIAWQMLYGTFLANPYLSGGESFDMLKPHIVPVLFSLKNGLFLYSPILLIGLTGIFIWKNHLQKWIITVILVELFVISTWSTWGQGASYGGRMFVSSLPLFAFGIAHGVHELLKKKILPFPALLVLLITLSLLNWLLIIRFLFIS